MVNRANAPGVDHLSITRDFNAPRDLVFKAWTEADRLKDWWGPEGFTSPVFKMDARVGGKYLACMRSEKGEEMWSTGVIREFSRPERLVLTDSFADQTGKVISASDVGMPGKWPLECIISLGFIENGNKTTMTMTHDGIPPEMIEDCRLGWQSSLNRFDKLLQASL